MKLLGYFLFVLYMICTLWLFCTAILQLHLYWLSRKKNLLLLKNTYENLPFITIQVPVYNEKYVIEELIQSLTEIDYPKHLFEIQILDDSTDETSIIIDNHVEHLKTREWDISVVRRNNRNGYKAGALQNGLEFCKGDYIAIFDADFRPPPHFFKSLLPYFKNRKVGLVQARWSHQNMQQNFLTRIQSFLLDMHFNVEQAGRYNAGYFINFCGTAGIWKKQCIIDAGGWDGDVLSEDLDISYRAQLNGWQIIFDKNVEVPSQLPAVIEAFKIQQFRWTKGIAQIARKTLSSICNMQLSLSKKLHSIYHLLSSFTFVCLLTTALLTVPLLHFKNAYPEFIHLLWYTLIGAFNLAALTFIYYKNSTTVEHNIKKFLLYYPLFLVVYLAMSVQNSIAVLQGFFGKKSEFVRTPKFHNTSGLYAYVSKSINWITGIETALLIYFFYGIYFSFLYKDFFFLLFFLLMCWGLLILVYQSLKPVRDQNKNNAPPIEVSKAAIS
jgi:cellulose synthase/poly-beta-1,6-N-acetylglucosamine synthase-like glycosyltransferase